MFSEQIIHAENFNSGYLLRTKFKEEIWMLSGVLRITPGRENCSLTLKMLRFEKPLSSPTTFPTPQHFPLHGSLSWCFVLDSQKTLLRLFLQKVLPKFQAIIIAWLVNPRRYHLVFSKKPKGLIFLLRDILILGRMSTISCELWSRSWDVTCKW